MSERDLQPEDWRRQKRVKARKRKAQEAIKPDDDDNEMDDDKKFDIIKQMRKFQNYTYIQESYDKKGKLLQTNSLESRQR